MATDFAHFTRAGGKPLTLRISAVTSVAPGADNDGVYIRTTDAKEDAYKVKGSYEDVLKALGIAKPSSYDLSGVS